MAERPRRRSRVLEYFEQQQAQREADDAAAAEEANNEENPNEENPNGGGDENPFQGFDSAFGLDAFGPRGSE